MYASKNFQIRGICISGALFLFYAPKFLKCPKIILSFLHYLCFNAKIPHRSAGFLPASRLSTRLGPSDRTWTCGLLTPSQARYQTSPHPDTKVSLWISNILPHSPEKIKREFKVFQVFQKGKLYIKVGQSNFVSLADFLWKEDKKWQ